MALIAITGVPGTGKSSVSKLLAEGGDTVFDLNKTVFEHNFILGHDEERDSAEVDMDALSNFALALEGKDTRTIFLEGHVSHLLPVDLIIVLRCRPTVLKKRLEARDWSKGKVRENLEAEAMAVITHECLDSGIDTYEIDVSDIKVEDIMSSVLDIVRGDKDLENFRPGRIDFFQEILKWC